ncbi:hypothetical protein CLOP_g10478, partial [Closterium sp. NIES-67]
LKQQQAAREAAAGAGAAAAAAAEATARAEAGETSPSKQRASAAGEARAGAGAAAASATAAAAAAAALAVGKVPGPVAVTKLPVPEFFPDSTDLADAWVSRPPIDEGKPIRWRKGELIGAGAYGCVYMGLNLESGELLAVKQVLIPSSSTTKEKAQEYIKGLEAEVAVLRNLSHPNIVRYLGTAREEEALNIFLEFVPGGSIASLLNKFGCFTEKVIRMYNAGLMTGLSYLHYNHIMHRDIKGANILVDNKGCIKLADFGASRKLADLATMSGYKSMKGTPYWMAPEVIKQTGHGRPADIWSVACTVIEMATGKPPWSEFLSQVSALFHIAQSKGPPLIPEHLSPEAKDFLLLCFHRDPNKRPSAAELLKLSAAAEAAAVTATAATGAAAAAAAVAAVTPTKAGAQASTTAGAQLSPTARGRSQGPAAAAAAAATLTAAEMSLSDLGEVPASTTDPQACPSLASTHNRQHAPSSPPPAGADTPTSRLAHPTTPTSRLTPYSTHVSHLTHDNAPAQPLESDSPDSSAAFSHKLTPLTPLTHPIEAGEPNPLLSRSKGPGPGQEKQGQRQDEQGKGDGGLRMSRAHLMSVTSTGWQPGTFSELSDLSFRSDFNPMEEPSHNDPLGSYVTAACGHSGGASQLPALKTRLQDLLGRT